MPKPQKAPQKNGIPFNMQEESRREIMRKDKIKKYLAAGLAAVMLLGSLGACAGLGLSGRLSAREQQAAARLSEAARKKEDARFWRLPEAEPAEGWPVVKTETYPSWTKPDFSADDMVYEHYEQERFEKARDEFLSTLGLEKDKLEEEPSKKIDEQTMSEALNKILAEYDYITTLSSYNQFIYTHDVTNQEAKDEMTYMETLTPEVFNILLETLQGVQKNKTLGPVLEAVLGEAKAEDLAESEVLTDRQKEIKEEIVKLEQKFDEIDGSGTGDEKGELYLSLVKLRNEYAAEEGFGSYKELDIDQTFGRDFTEDDLETYYAAVKKHMSKFYLSLMYKLDWNEIDAFRLPKGKATQDLVGAYLGNISSELLDSFNYMLDHKLYSFGTDEKNENVSYTISLPSDDSALIFVHDNGDFSNLSTLIHEFGHFNTAVRETGDSFFSHSNIDLAEIHSQGLELLFLPYAGELYGEAAASASNYILLNMVWAVLTGCLYHEFESYAYSTPDVTLDELRAKYKELASDYLGSGLAGEDDWQFWHMYHAPLYYISYSLSAMASLTLLPHMEDDWRGTVSRYLKLTSFGEERYPFRETLEQSGLPDIFEEETVEEIAGAIQLWSVKPFLLTPQDGALPSESSENAEGSKKETEPEETSRPSISLPEYGTEASETTAPFEESLPSEDEGPIESQIFPDGDDGFSDFPFDPDPQTEFGLELWEGSGEAGAADLLKALPGIFNYCLSGEMFADFVKIIVDMAGIRSSWDGLRAAVPSEWHA